MTAADIIMNVSTLCGEHPVFLENISCVTFHGSFYLMS